MEVTSAEFKTRFGYYREVAQREPVAVTAHGRPSVVVISAEEYRRLKDQNKKPRAAYIWELDDEELEILANSEPAPECAELDHLVDSEDA